MLSVFYTERLLNSKFEIPWWVKVLVFNEKFKCNKIIFFKWCILSRIMYQELLCAVNLNWGFCAHHNFVLDLDYIFFILFLLIYICIYTYISINYIQLNSNFLWCLFIFRCSKCTELYIEYVNFDLKTDVFRVYRDIIWQ